MSPRPRDSSAQQFIGEELLRSGVRWHPKMVSIQGFLAGPKSPSRILVGTPNSHQERPCYVALDECAEVQSIHAQIESAKPSQRKSGPGWSLDELSRRDLDRSKAMQSTRYGKSEWDIDGTWTKSAKTQQSLQRAVDDFSRKQDSRMQRHVSWLFCREVRMSHLRRFEIMSTNTKERQHM